MDKIIGTNLGNWLVLEKWMQPFIFQGTGAEDETWLNRNVPKEKLWPMMKQHRDTYVTEEDFHNIASHDLTQSAFRFRILFSETENHIVAVSNIWTKLLTGQKSMA